jgi:hypothetical protein
LAIVKFVILNLTYMYGFKTAYLKSKICNTLIN